MINMQKDIIPEVRIKTTLWLRWILSSDLWETVRLQMDDVSLARFPGQNSSPERTATPSFTCWKDESQLKQKQASSVPTWPEAHGWMSFSTLKVCIVVLCRNTAWASSPMSFRAVWHCDSTTWKWGAPLPSIEKLENSGGEKTFFFSLLHIFFKNYRVLTRMSLAAHLSVL